MSLFKKLPLLIIVVMCISSCSKTGSANEVKNEAAPPKIIFGAGNYAKSTLFTSPGKANPDKDFEYHLNDEGDKVVIYKCKASGKVVIPLTIEGLPVAMLTAVQPAKSTGGALLSGLKSLAAGLIAENDGIFKTATSVYIPDGIEIIDEIFRNCKLLKEVRLPDGLVNIPNRLFEGAESLDTFNVPDSVKYIGAWAFLKTKKLTKLELPDHVGLASYVFEDSGIKEIRWPSGCDIMMGVFQGSDLESIVIPEGVIRIYGSAFKGCNKLKSVTLPLTLKSIGRVPGDEAFLVFGDGQTFRKCKNLTTVIIPDELADVEFVGTYHFTETNLPLATQARLKKLGVQRDGYDDYLF